MATYAGASIPLRLMTHILPFPHSFLDHPFCPFLPLSSSPFPLEVGPSNPVRGFGERCKLPQPTAKRYLVHFGQKTASGESNFKDTFTKNMFAFSLYDGISVVFQCFYVVICCF